MLADVKQNKQNHIRSVCFCSLYPSLCGLQYQEALKGHISFLEYPSTCKIKFQSLSSILRLVSGRHVLDRFAISLHAFSICCTFLQSCLASIIFSSHFHVCALMISRSVCISFFLLRWQDTFLSTSVGIYNPIQIMLTRGLSLNIYIYIHIRSYINEQVYIYV